MASRAAKVVDLFTEPDELDDFEVDMQALNEFTPEPRGGDEDISSMFIFSDRTGMEIPPADGPRHYDNLAEFISESELSRTASELIDAYRRDRESRRDWEKLYADGLDELGMMTMRNHRREDEAFAGASTVHHPVLIEAAVEFNARALPELFPSDGPVKTKIIGEMSEQAQAQAERVEHHMNWQLADEWEEFYPDLDQMLLELPLSGSAFKKVYSDPTLGRGCSRYVKSEDLVVPYHCTDLSTAPRVSHLQYPTRNEVRKRMVEGYYRHVDLVMPRELSQEYTEVKTRIDEMEGRSNRNDARSEDRPDTLIEMHVELSLADDPYIDQHGYEHDIALPYVVTIDLSSRQILSWRRNWQPDDRLYRKEQYFVHFKFLPGFGFYGFGLIHTIGHLARAATGSLRALLDSAAFANLQGGFKRKGSSGRGLTGEQVLSPGEFKEVDVGDDIRKDVMQLNFPEPSSVLFQLLGMLVEAAQRFASIADLQVGDAPNTGPVGTTVALLEQGSRVFSAIHKRGHQAQRRELRLIAALNYEALPDGASTFGGRGGTAQIMREDYSDPVDVIPVSDPNIFSQTQRLTLAQSLDELAERNPSIMDKRAVVRRVLVALRVSDIDEVLPPPYEPPQMDPITENQMVLFQRPIRVYEPQDHNSHITVHLLFTQQQVAEMEAMGATPEVVQGFISVMQAHIAEHMAYQYKLTMGQALGDAIQLPVTPPMADQKQLTRARGIPTELDRQISKAAAQAAPMVAQTLNEVGHAAKKGPTKEEIEAQKVQQTGERDAERTEIEKQRVGIEARKQKHQEDLDWAKLELEAATSELQDIELDRLKANSEITIKQQVAEQQARIQEAAARAKVALDRWEAEQKAALKRRETESDIARKDRESHADVARDDRETDEQIKQDEKIIDARVEGLAKQAAAQAAAAKKTASTTKSSSSAK